MSRMKKANTLNESNAIDLTPMLDVVFIMLIFFIVTASFINERGIDPNIPPLDNKVPEGPSNMLVRISADNQIWFFDKEAERRVDVRTIRSVIARARAENPKSSLIIQASEKADTAIYVLVADAAAEVGVASALVSKAD